VVVGVHAVMGTGGAPEGVANAALCGVLNGQDSGAACDCETAGRQTAGKDGREGYQHTNTMESGSWKKDDFRLSE